MATVEEDSLWFPLVACVIAEMSASLLGCMCVHLRNDGILHCMVVHTPRTRLLCPARWNSGATHGPRWTLFIQAERVMRTLRQLAKDGHTVICSIHQVSDETVLHPV